MSTFPKPLADRVIVLEDAPDEKIGNVIVPDTAKEKSRRGEIKAVGLGKKNGEGVAMPLDVEVGMRVSFHKFAGTEMVIDGESHIVLRESEIIAVL